MYGVNNSGQIAGSFFVNGASSGGSQGYVDDGGTFSPVDVPGATATQVYGINDLGQVVGVATDASGNRNGFIATPVCFAAGTTIRTPRRNVAVEHLVIGDLVVTASGAHRAIRWLGHRVVDCRRYADPRVAWPVCIDAHAFGAGKPARDLIVSPGHAVCVDLIGEVLIPASTLVNGLTIRQIEVDTVTYWHVELETHDILLAEDLPTESYFEVGNRGFFGEGGLLVLAAGPDAQVAKHADFCRPFVANGPLVEAIRGATIEARGGQDPSLVPRHESILAERYRLS